MSQLKVKNIVFKDMIVNEISCNNNIDSTLNKIININNLNINGDLSANNSSVYHNNNIGIGTTPNYNLEVIGDISFSNNIFQGGGGVKINKDTNVNINNVYVTNDISVNQNIIVTNDISINGDLKIGNNINTSFRFDKILQIKSITKKNKQTINSYVNNYNFNDDSKILNFTLNITPSSSSSKIFLMINLFVAGVNDAYIQGLVKRTIGDTTTTLIANTGVGSATNMSFGINNTNANNIADNLLFPIGFRYLDTPNTTQQISYFIQIRNRYTGTSTNSTLYINAPSFDGWSQPSSVSTMTAFEFSS